jgi:hypothetical protein
MDCAPNRGPYCWDISVLDNCNTNDTGLKGNIFLTGSLHFKVNKNEICEITDETIFPMAPARSCLGMGKIITYEGRNDHRYIDHIFILSHSLILVSTVDSSSFNNRLSTLPK